MGSMGCAVGDVVRLPIAGFAPTSAGRPSATPEVGAVRVVIDGVEHYLDATDAAFFAAEFAHAVTVALELREEARRG